MAKLRRHSATAYSVGDLTKTLSDIDYIEYSSCRDFSLYFLDVSFYYLKEGISRMEMVLRHTSTHTRNVLAAITHAAIQMFLEASASTKQRPVDYSLFLDFEIVSQEIWVLAKESFQESREIATRAFDNRAMSIKGRIIASRLRIANNILEKFLDDPEAAAQESLLYLQELHDLPAIRKTFRVHIRKGFKSHLNKTKRSKIVNSVTAINKILSDLMLTFMSHTVLSDRFEWPVIQLTDSKLPRKYIIVDVQRMKQEVREKFSYDPRSRLGSCCLDNPNLREDHHKRVDFGGKYSAVDIKLSVGRSDNTLQHVSLIVV